ncbi:Fe-S oxidoreductase [Marisediminicola sp. LYQ134]|uniref:Fe-S oxidoreductase n=1 Tax=Marisediminicola sp. LYQ134 TaxID=3391061 RepID=UPI003983CCC5
MTPEATPALEILEAAARSVCSIGAASPVVRRIALDHRVVAVGYAIATAGALVWGAALSTGPLEREHGLVVARGCPRWAFGRGGTTIGGVYLTRDSTSPTVIEHEAVHREQWRRYGLAFIPLYVAAGPDARSNRFEREAGLERGGYA